MTTHQDQELDFLESQLTADFEKIIKDNPALIQRLVTAAIRSVLLSWGGTQLRIPSLESLLNKSRNKKIRALRKEQKLSISQLKERFDLPRRKVRRILSRPKTKLIE